MILLFALLALILTYLAQRGPHSRLHHTLAGAAMACEVLLIATSLTGRHAESLTLVVCIVTIAAGVFFTDTREGKSYWEYLVELVRVDKYI